MAVAQARRAAVEGSASRAGAAEGAVATIARVLEAAMRRTISLVCSLLAGPGLAAGAAGGSHADAAASDQLARAPAAVRKTIDREAHGQPVQSLSAKQEYGHTVYTAGITRPGADKPLRL